jgi:deoxyribodipyrimidine photo-lyase
MVAVTPSLVWFRQDLRLADNPALAAAATAGPIIAVYILDDETPGSRRIGGASRWWLHQSLRSLTADLAERRLSLVLRRGPAAAVLSELIDESGAQSVFWNRCYEPGAIARDTTIKQQLTANGIRAGSFNASLLMEPWEIKTGGGDPYRVFTPFWRALSGQMLLGEVPPIPPLSAGPALQSDRLEDWKLLPTKPDWAGGLRDAWQPGEAGARHRLADFIDDGLSRYADERNRPDQPSSSSLSPHLHWGEISPGQIWRSVRHAADTSPALERHAASFLREIGWREFSYHLLYHFSYLPERPLRPEFERFEWMDDPALRMAWSRGKTGYPLVDAGMRQLWQTGWMHNRVRMVVASFLVKHLLQDWRLGEDWFWDTLVDADLASNAASWQWVAGSGADAAPYFRIMNPILQGQKFDPNGDYVRKFVPEIAGLPTEHLHTPWEAPAAVLAQAGIELGRTYPYPIIDHATGRNRALAAFARLRD